MLQLALRARRYHFVHADRAGYLRTDFFAAAAVVTRAVAWAGPSKFLLQLSTSLEGMNMRRATAIRAGELYGTGTVADNTEDFIHAEQCAVQRYLDSFRRQAPGRYRSEIAGVNRAMRFAASLPSWGLGPQCFVRALGRARMEHCGDVTFASQTFREAVGRHLVAALRRPRMSVTQLG